MDLEFLFSSNPFVGSGGADRFSIIKPNLSAPLKLGAKKGEKKFKLPEEFRSTNVLVEVVAAGQKAARPTTPTPSTSPWSRTTAASRCATRKPASRCRRPTIKVYARDRDGSVKFYKDGYTDLRGKFDYASLNTSQLGTAERFSILVMTEGNGSLVKEVRTAEAVEPAPEQQSRPCRLDRSEREPTDSPIECSDIPPLAGAGISVYASKHSPSEA